MPTIKLTWMPHSRAEFERLKKRAVGAGKRDEFLRVHNEIVRALRDSDLAFEKGELRFRTRRPGGEVRLWVNEFIAVGYVVFREPYVGWVLKYSVVPEEWPQQGSH